MIDHSKSVAFCKEQLNKTNSCLSKIGKGRLFFVWHYTPKAFDKKESYKSNFITMVLNINTLFYDCMPWFLCLKPNKSNKSLAEILKEMTSIDYEELKNRVIIINKIRNLICHNTSRFDYEIINNIFLSIDSSIIITDWISFNTTAAIWEKCFEYFLLPIDNYFKSLLDFMNRTLYSDLSYNDNDWDTILSSHYADNDFINNIALYTLSDLYNYQKSDLKRRVNPDKIKQIKKWKKSLDFDTLRSLVIRNKLNDKKRDEIRPEKYFISLLDSML